MIKISDQDLFHEGVKAKFKRGDKVVLIEGRKSVYRDDKTHGKGPFTIKRLATIPGDPVIWYSVEEPTPYRYKEEDLRRACRLNRGKKDE